jgi:hypothetical protein
MRVGLVDYAHSTRQNKGGFEFFYAIRVSGSLVLGLENLRVLNHLLELEIAGTRVTASGATSLQRSLPKCWIEDDHISQNQ